MKITLLKKAVLTKELKKLPEWSLNPKATSLSCTRTFKNHIDALVFIARITVHAQVLDHHPEIVFTFKKVKVVLTTHDVKGLTSKDIELAKRISEIDAGG
jgi:4a-hydroxytetrahydrobiopterin dehydratase